MQINKKQQWNEETMTVIKKNDTNQFYRKACIVMIWCIAVYSSIIQNKFIQIPHIMFMLGGVILVFYILANNKMFDFYESVTAENRYMLYFMAYMLIAGLLFSPDTNSHFIQWFTCAEYLFLQIVISSIIKESGTDTFSTLLFAEAATLCIIFIRDPIDYLGSGRYSISNEVNPNGLGMLFTAGIWAVLYRQQKSKLPFILTGGFVVLFSYCILLTGSRKALIGAGIVFVLWLFFGFLPSLKKRGFVFGTLTFIIMIIFIVIVRQEFWELYESMIGNRMDKLLYEATEGTRNSLYRVGYEILQRNPLFGTGFQGFKYYYGRYYSHATLIEVPVSGGIIGAILYFVAYCISIKKIVYLYKITKKDQQLYREHTRVKMISIVLALMIFYTTCIIHPYEFDSCILFGIIFGETAYIEKALDLKQDIPGTKKIRSKYIRYE